MTAVEWLHENNKVIAQMLLDNKISQSIIDQLFNCFVINLEQAKQKENEQLHKCASFWRGKENEIEKPIFEHYYNETFKK